MVDNYGSYVPSMPLSPENASTDNEIHTKQMNFVQVKEFVAEQMEAVGDYCDPLKQRWDDWLVSWGPTCSGFTDT